MGRERPTAAPRAVPDAQRGVEVLKHESVRQRHAREELERLKATQGPGFFAAVAHGMGIERLRPRFIRRGYEEGILDELRAFYEARPRPWRPAACSPKANRRTGPKRLGRKAMQRRQLENRSEIQFGRRAMKRMGGVNA